MSGLAESELASRGEAVAIEATIGVAEMLAAEASPRRPMYSPLRFRV
jgi:hypothetical protein